MLAWAQLYEIIKHQQVTTIEQQKAIILADTFCIHGDHEDSVELLDYIHNQLLKHQIRVKDV